MIPDCLPPSPPATIDCCRPPPSIDGGGGGKEKGIGAGNLPSALSQLSPTGMKPSGTLWGGKGQVNYVQIHLCPRHRTEFGSLNACNFLLSEQKLFRTIGQQSELEPESFAIGRAQAGGLARPEAPLCAEVAMLVSDLAMLANALASICSEAATMVTPSNPPSVVSEPLKLSNAEEMDKEKMQYGEAFFAAEDKEELHEFKYSEAAAFEDLSGTQMFVDGDDSQLLYSESKRRAARDSGAMGYVQIDVEPTKRLEFKSSEDKAQAEEGLPATASNELVLVAHDAQEQQDEPAKDASEPEPRKAEVNLDSLNITELKQRLMAGGIVDFVDCFEKSDLIDKIKTFEGNYAKVDVAAAPEYKIQNVNDTELELFTNVAPGVVQEESANLVELETEQADRVTASNGPAPATDDSKDPVPATECWRGRSGEEGRNSSQ